MAQPVYKVWKGRNKFLLNGRLVFGPDASSLIVTLLLILVPVVIFCAFVARNLIHEFPTENAGYAVFVAAVVFTVYVLLLLLLTSACDPGIVPRSPHPLEDLSGYDSSASVEVGGRQSLQLPRTKEVFVNGLPVRVKYCETCMIYRPPRCSHCSVCDNCVEKFDHHCPWVGQCIGKRNYRCFFLFVSSSALLCIFVFSMSALYMKFLMDGNGTAWEAVKQSPASVVLMAYCFVLFWFVGGLTSFHLYLIATNQTTYELFRYKAENRINVYDRGCANNYGQVFCAKNESSRINFRAYETEEASKPPSALIQGLLVGDTDEGRREKVEDNLEMGNDLLKISQCPDTEEATDVRSRATDSQPQQLSEVDYALGLESHVSSSKFDRHHSNMRRKNERR
ncbi:unnamed protein product [Coffea canephora]|uniref:S-acyltransferase n=1 Tax=Coffea canephora TaxID=49390 RepID=A0A068UWD5_COFCA|nr:unnamed protein product [Coffea canephora]